MPYRQLQFDCCLEWGGPGLAALRDTCDIIVIVDVFSFSTATEIATARGALIYPCMFDQKVAAEYAQEIGAQLALPRRRGNSRYSLSPASLTTISKGTKLVLPSRNGSALSLNAKSRNVLAGCFRNAAAVAARATSVGRRIGIVPAGERWPDGSLRPAIEDYLGAGAVLTNVPGSKSPEAQLAINAFESVRDKIADIIMQSVSGQELMAAGYDDDLSLAVDLNISDCVPQLEHGCYRSRTVTDDS